MHGFTLQDDLGTENVVARSEAEALTVWLRAVRNPPAGDVRVWRRESATDSPQVCDVFRLRREKLSPENWPLAQSRSDPRGWNEWDLVRREARRVRYT
jgi:hypothetical protein